MNNLHLFDKFTERARKVLSLAQEEAQHFQHDAIGTEHLLLGLVCEGESVAAQVLESLNVTPEKVRKAVEEAKGHGNGMVQGEIMLSPHANMAIEMAIKEAGRRFPSPSTNPENRLLGSIHMPESDAVKILQSLGVPPLKDFRTLVFLEQVTTLQTTNQGYTQRFTRPARKAWSLAHEEARRLQDSYVGTHHLLLGLMGEGSGVAATVLAEMGVRLDEMREKVEPDFEQGDWNVPGDIKLQPRLKNIIELASNEARRLHHPSIGTGHLLLVLARHGEGIASGLLKSLGVDLDKMRAATRHVLSEQASESGQEAEAVTDEISEQGVYASNASIASIERNLQSRELDKTLLAVYPFTLEARRVLEHARLTARNLAQRVGPEHLLVGLASLTFRHDGPTSKVLGDLGIDFARVQAAVEKRQAQGVKTAPVVLVQSALCRAYLLLAADEAEQRDGRGAPIRSEHLLLGLLREEKGIIADLLGDLGTSVETVRTKVGESLSTQNP